MQSLTCPRPACARQTPPVPWTVTGRMNYSKRLLLRAELSCTRCGRLFSSGRPEAITAARAAGAMDPPRPDALQTAPDFVPAPGWTTTTAPRQAFISLRDILPTALRDGKLAALPTGDDE